MDLSESSRDEEHVHKQIKVENWDIDQHDGDMIE